LTNYLEIVFPDRIGEIGRLRRLDTGFDEICSDFELIAALANQADGNDKERQHDKSDDIRNTYSGLHQEITEMLARRA
jgi:hypothetical protein